MATDAFGLDRDIYGNVNMGSYAIPIASFTTGTGGAAGGVGASGASGAGNVLGDDTVTTRSFANKSPELEALMQSYYDELKTRGAGTKTAYENLANTYADVINQIRRQAGSAAGTAGSGAATSALASGMTPYQATGANRTAFLDTLLQMTSGIPSLYGKRAEAGVDYEKAMKDLLSLSGEYQANIAKPYWTGVAGQVQTVTDPFKRSQLAAEYAKMAQQQQQAQMEADLRRQQMQQQYDLGLLQNETERAKAQAQQDYWNSLIEGRYGGSTGGLDTDFSNYYGSASGGSTYGGYPDYSGLDLQELESANFDPFAYDIGNIYDDLMYGSEADALWDEYGLWTDYGW